MEIVTPPSPNLFERFNRWIQESIMVKLFSIGFLLLVLLIPSAWIRELIAERQQRADDVIAEVADKWSNNQTVSGPVLVIPFKKHEVIDRGAAGKEVYERVEKAFFLPEDLDINGNVSPEMLHRGIFDAVVYSSSMQIKSTFVKPDFKTLSVPEENVQWSDAYMIFGITDLRGISDNPEFMIGGKPFKSEPSNDIGVMVWGRGKDAYTEHAYETNTVNDPVPHASKGIVVKLGWENSEAFTGNVSIKLNLKGSRRLDFVPTGKTTSVKMSGPWADPSFDGEFIPSTREVSESGFTATWKVLHFNRPFSQQWTGNDQQLSGADFGLKLLVPVDQYQKSMRTSKYGVLVILLTFVALFLIEITQRIRIHPFQYILIGAALSIYYTLLLSFSEHIGYNWAYVASSAATIVLITLYSTTFLKSAKLAALFSFLLTVFYSFIFVIILQQDFSLLLGSVGLFIIISVLMYFSRKVNWYSEEVVA